MPRRKQPYGLVKLLARRGDGPLLGVVRQEGPAMAQRLEEMFFHCNVDFGLVVGETRAATLARRSTDPELRPEWVALRLTLEHLVYYTGRIQLFLSAALADGFVMGRGSLRSDFRFPRVRTRRQQPELGAMVRAWRRLLARRVGRRDRRAEFRLLADAALFVASANLRFSEMLVSHIGESW